jgi:hypothetical protein
VRDMPGQPALEWVQEGTRDGTPQPIVPDGVEPLGQHLRPNAAHARQRWPGPGLPALVLRLLIAAADVTLLAREPPAMGQCDLVDLPAQVIQDLLRALDGGCAGDAPALGPHRRRDGPVRPFLTHQRPQHPAQARRAGVYGPQRGPAGWRPLDPIGGDPASGHEAVHVRRGGEGTGPGVPHPEAPEQPTAIMRSGREREERLGRGAQHAIVQVLLLPPDARPPLLGHGADDVTGGPRQECPPALGQPGVGVEAMPRGATAVAAGVGDVVLLATAVARSQRPSQRFGPAGEASREGPARARQPVRPQPVHVLLPIAPEDVRHRWPAEAPARSVISPEGGDGGVPASQGRGRQRHVTGGGPGALVAQQGRHDPPRHAPFQQRGTRGVPQRMAGGLRGHAALAPHAREGLVKGGRRERRLLGASGAQPEAGPLALPVLPSPRQPPGGEGHAAVLAPYAAAYRHQHPWRVHG